MSLKHILIVENDYMVLEMLGELLKGLGYRASIAGEGNEARAILSREAVDLLLADELLPGESRTRAGGICPLDRGSDLADVGG